MVLSLVEEIKQRKLMSNESLLLGLRLTQTLQPIQCRHCNHRLAFVGSGSYDSLYFLSYLVEFFSVISKISVDSSDLASGQQGLSIRSFMF